MIALLATSVVPSGGSTAVATGVPAGTAAASAASEGSRFTPLTPTRILDTRTTNGVPVAGELGPREVLRVDVTGRGGVPDTGVSAVVLHVTAIGPTTRSSLTVWPSDSPRPAGSNLYLRPGDVSSNLVVTDVGSDGRIRFHNRRGTVHVLADVAGYYGSPGATSGSLHHAITPARILDSRDGTGVAAGKVGEGETRILQVTGRGGIPGDGVSAVLLHLTAIGASDRTFLTVWPDGTTRPSTSALDTEPHAAVANLAVAELGSGGRIRVHNRYGTVHVVGEVVGWYGTDGALEGARFSTLPSARILDTRDGTGVTTGKIGDGSSKLVQVTGVGGVPSTGVSAVVLNLTGTDATKSTFLSVYPSGTSRPSVEHLRVEPATTTLGLVVSEVGSDGRIRIYNDAGQVHAVGRVVGWYGAESSYTDLRFLSRNQYGTGLRDVVSAVDANRDVHVAWRESSQLLYRKVDRFGNTLIHTVATGWPVTSTGFGARYVQLAPQPDGGVAILWIHDGDILGARLDGAGRVVLGPKVIANGSYQYLAADSDAAGNVYLIVNEIRLHPSTASSGRAGHLRLTPNLVPSATQQFLSRRIDSGATRYTGLAVEPDGTLHVAWFQERNQPTQNRYDVHYARYYGPDPPISRVLSASSEGYPMSGDSAGLDNEGPKIDVDATGRVHVAWITGHRLYYSALTDDGTLTATGVQVDLDDHQTTTKYFDGDVVAMPDGTASIVFSSGPDASSKLVKVRVDATGAVRVPALLLPMGAGSFRTPGLAVVSGHEIIVGLRVLSAAGKVFFTTTAPRGRPTEVPDLVVDDAHSTNTSWPSPAREGTVVTMTARVANTGLATSPATTATFRYDGTLLGTVPVPTLAPEASAPVEWAWTVPTPMAVDVADITVEVDPSDAIDEATEANNVAVHEVPIWLRPTGAVVSIAGYDETADEDREGYDHVDGVTAHLTGTPSEGGGSFDQTVVGGSWTSIPNVPPGTYVMTASKAGYSTVAPFPVTVTRDPGNPYLITVSPSTLVDVWFNRWGSITGTVTASGGGPLSGVVVTDTTSGRTGVTGPDGSYTLAKLVPGTHLLNLTRNGYARQLAVPVDVSMGVDADGDRAMTPTANGYLDVSVFATGGADLQQASVQIIDGGGDPVGAACDPDARGRCSFEVTAGTAVRVRTTAPRFDDRIDGPYTLAAGQVVDVSAEMSLTVGALSWSNRSAYVTSWMISQIAPGDVDTYWQEFFGNYHVDLSAGRQPIGGVPWLQALNLSFDGDAFTFVHISDDEDDTYGAEDGGVQEVDSSIGPDWDRNDQVLRSIIRVDAIRVVDLETDAVLWQIDETSGLLPVYSGPGWDDDAALALTPGVELGDADLGIAIDLRVFEGDPAAGSGPLGGYGSAAQTIVWRPDGGFTVYGRPT